MSGTRRLSWVGLAVSAVALLMIAAFGDRDPVTGPERVQALSETFACPECAGQSVAESNAAVAATIREFVRDEVAAGSSDTEIRDVLLERYGTDVLLNPPAEGFASLIWILPVMVMVLGTGGLIAVVKRRPTGARTATDADAALVAEARDSGLGDGGLGARDDGLDG